MSLRADALSAAAENAAAAQNKQAEAWQRTVALVTDWFRQHFAVDATYLDTVTYSDAIVRDRYTHSVTGVTGTKYTRWQVDDVVFLVTLGYNGVEQVFLEGVCTTCQLPTRCRGYGIHTPWSKSVHTDDDRRAALIKEVATQLGPVVCKMCEANLPRRCDHCQRSL